MSLLSLLNTGSLGIAASQLGTQVTSNNLSNIGTEGYSRQQVSARPEQGLSDKGATTRVIEPFVERRLLSASSASGEASAESLALQPLDTIFADGAGSLGDSIDQFQASIQQLSSRPNDMAVREQVLSRAGNVASAFQNASAGLSQARQDANQRITGTVDEVNQRLRQISSLTGQISKAEVTGTQASQMRDQRDQLVREVAQRIPVNAVEGDNGQFSLLLNGSQALVTPEGKVNELGVSNASGDVRVTKMAAGTSIDVTNLLTSGSIGGQIKARDGALTQISQKLDQMAYDFQSQYNQVHSAGVAMDGNSGYNLFAPASGVTGAASQMALSADVQGKPENLAAATDAAALPSDNRNALALTQITTTPIGSSGMTVTEALASLSGSAGMAVQNAQQSDTFASGALDQVTALRESMSGVSSDEEMVSMMRYQRSYEASLQVVSVADQMMGELMNLRR